MNFGKCPTNLDTQKKDSAVLSQKGVLKMQVERQFEVLLGK